MTMAIVDGNGTVVQAFALGDGTGSDPYRYAPMNYHDALVDQGLVFQYSERQGLANNGTLDHLLVIPSGAHIELLQFKIATDSAPINVDIRENVIVSANGTLHTSYNLNRQSANASVVNVYESPTVTDPGTLIIADMATGNKNVGGTDQQSGRIILAADIKYLLRIQNVSGGNANLSINIRWGED